MKVKVKNTLLAAMAIAAVLLALAACGSNQRPANVTVEVPSGLSPNASVSGRRHLSRAAGPLSRSKARGGTA